MAIQFYPGLITDVPLARREDCYRMALIAFHHGVLADPSEFDAARMTAFGPGPLPADDKEIWEALRPHLFNE